jgi:hypothetical protein
MLLAGCSEHKGLHDDFLNRDIVVLDARGLADQLDISGLAEGDHVIELDAYVPASRAWTEADTSKLKDRLRSRRIVPQPKDVGADLEVLEVVGRADRRTVRITLHLDGPGTWYTELRGSGVGEASTSLLGQYALDDPETLPGSETGIYVPISFIRTVGSCRHAVSVRHRFAASGKPVGWEVLFSEPFAAMAPSKAKAKLPDGTDFETPFSMQPAKAGAAVNVDLPMAWSPQLAGVTGVWKLPLAATDHVAGAFATSFSCEESDGEVPLITWIDGLPESVMSKQYVVSPLAAAMASGQTKVAAGSK